MEMQGIWDLFLPFGIHFSVRTEKNTAWLYTAFIELFIFWLGPGFGPGIQHLAMNMNGIVRILEFIFSVRNSLIRSNGKKVVHIYIYIYIYIYISKYISISIINYPYIYLYLYLSLAACCMPNTALTRRNHDAEC